MRGPGALWLMAVVAGLGVGCSDSNSASQSAPTPGAATADDHAASVDADDLAEDAEGEVSDVEGADSSVGSAGDEPAGGDPEWFTPYEERVYPLAAFIGELRADLFPESVEFDADPMGATEAMTHDCMTAQGFRYEIVDWAAIDAEIDAAMPSLAEKDFMPTWGYGVAFSLGAPQVIEHSYVDPNDAIQDGLSDSEREAWLDQLGECYSRASAEIDRPSIVGWALENDRESLREGVYADSRVVEAGAEWSRCMTEQGHHYASEEEIFDYLDSIAGPLEERVRAQGGRDHIGAVLQADLDALKAIEVEIATADLSCKKRLEQVIYEVTVEHEQRFLDENQDRLALLREEIPTMTIPVDFWWR